MECILFVAAIVVAGVVFGVVSVQQTAKAKARYERMLAELRNDPTNPKKREAALAIGRLYSRLSRNSKGVALFDEMALKNDLDAATAGAVSVRAPQASIPVPAMTAASHEDRLAKLESLRSKGLITEDEYGARRQAIIDDI